MSPGADRSRPLRLGIVGACRRGASFKEACAAIGGIEVAAACDTNAQELPQAAQRLGARQQYTDYERMLDRAELDAVIVATPMPLHVPQSQAALERDLHVLCEVPAAVSVAEARNLVLSARGSKGRYMMAENYTYRRENVLVRELVRQGLFGTPYYAEGEYLHELKDLNEITVWRRLWQTGVRGITYGTHSLGPVLQWLQDRVVRVACAGSGAHYRDPRGVAYHDDTAILLAKTSRDALVKIRVDMVSDRPHAMANYQLQGTDGVYESSRQGPGDQPVVWLRTLDTKPAWTPLPQLEERYLSPQWRERLAAAAHAGHGGGDYLEVLEFVQSIRAGQAPAIGIDEAMDMTLPGLVSQASILDDGAWHTVPDSRRWGLDSRPEGSLEMLLPPEVLAGDLRPQLPDGYRLRLYGGSDAPGYLALMARAGFDNWSAGFLARTLRGVLPDGVFVVEQMATGRLVATAMATHARHERHPSGGELGWVAADPDHSGRGLGKAVCTAALARYQAAGYRRVFLRTQDHRTPALKVYLDLGFQPLLYRSDQADRWRSICERLQHPFAPERWQAR